MSHPPRNEPHVPLSWSTGLPYLASQWVRDGHPLGAASALLRAGFEFRRGRSVPSSSRRIGIQHTLLTCTSRIGTSRHSLSPSPRASRSRPYPYATWTTMSYRPVQPTGWMFGILCGLPPAQPPRPKGRRFWGNHHGCVAGRETLGVTLLTRHCLSRRQFPGVQPDYALTPS